MAMVGVVMIGRVDVCFSDIELIMRMTAVIMAVAMGGRFDDTCMERR